MPSGPLLVLLSWMTSSTTCVLWEAHIFIYSKFKNHNGLALAPDLAAILNKQDVGLWGNCFLFDFLG